MYLFSKLRNIQMLFILWYRNTYQCSTWKRCTESSNDLSGTAQLFKSTQSNSLRVTPTFEAHPWSPAGIPALFAPDRAAFCWKVTKIFSLSQNQCMFMERLQLEKCLNFILTTTSRSDTCTQTKQQQADTSPKLLLGVIRQNNYSCTQDGLQPFTRSQNSPNPFLSHHHLAIEEINHNKRSIFGAILQSYRFDFSALQLCFVHFSSNLNIPFKPWAC